METMTSFSSIDPMLLGSLAGFAIFVGLCSVLGIVIIFRRAPRRHRDGTPDDAVETEGEPAPPTILDTASGYSGQLRGALLVLVAGVLLLAIGLPVGLVMLPETVTPVTEPAPPAAVPEQPTVSPPPPAEPEPNPVTVTEPEPEQNPEPEPEPKTEPNSGTEPSVSNIVVGNLTLTLDPESGYNWYDITVDVSNPGDSPETLTLHSRVGDRLVTPRTIVLKAGENLTLSLDRLAREVGFLATIYEKGIITQRRHELVVHDIRETLVFEPPARLALSDTDKDEMPDWELLNSTFGVYEVLEIAEAPLEYRYRWEITLRSNRPPHRNFKITVSLFDVDGGLIQESTSEENELLRWSTRSFSGLVILTEEEAGRLTSHRIAALCTSGCGEEP